MPISGAKRAGTVSEAAKRFLERPPTDACRSVRQHLLRAPFGRYSHDRNSPAADGLVATASWRLGDILGPLRPSEDEKKAAAETGTTAPMLATGWFRGEGPAIVKYVWAPVKRWPGESLSQLEAHGTMSVLSRAARKRHLATWVSMVRNRGMTDRSTLCGRISLQSRAKEKSE